MRFYLLDKGGEFITTRRYFGPSVEVIPMAFTSMEDAIEYAKDAKQSCTVVRPEGVATVTHEVTHRVLVHPL